MKASVCRPTPANMPIPDRLNTLLVVVVALGGVGLLWLGSRLESWWAIGAVGVAFSYLMLTNYALLHEATHGNLHSRSGMNYLLGLVTGSLFPIPYTMIRTTHQGHHLRNRTDFEMFDLYYDTDSRVFRYGQWYGILCGLFYPWVPLGAVLFALCPSLLRTRYFRKARATRHLLGDIRAREVTAIRLEMLLIVGLFALLFWLLELRWQSVLIAYACFSFNWSTRQYIGHAFTPRDVIEGAWNLRTSRLLDWILLHGEYDLNHHRHPEAPWYYLPGLTRKDDPRPNYLVQYWRQWLGPRRCTEPAPEVVETIPLSVHE